MKLLKEYSFRMAKWLCFHTVLTISAQAEIPNLTDPGVIDQVKASSFPGQGRGYKETYNLGATGLRGWIYIDPDNAGYRGAITAQSKQILVSTVGLNTPASGIIAVDDVILGANSSTSGTVTPFNEDCRKELGKAIGNAEVTGTLRVLRWRKNTGAIAVNITMFTLGAYAPTAPYNCEKSEKILKLARNNMVAELLADPQFLTKSTSHSNPISALALLASVERGSPNYNQVQIRLRDYALSLTPSDLVLYGCNTWGWSYTSIFLNEYYLRIVEDSKIDPTFFNSALIARILAGANKYTIGLAKAQGIYGTYGHGGSELLPNGGLHGPIPSYGTINSSGIPANIAIVLGKKVMELSGLAVNSEVGPAIERASKFFGYYVDKGSIPYGEHLPWSTHVPQRKSAGHSSNGKDQMCAVFFGLQENRLVEAKYYTSMSVAGYSGIEYGHTGQGFSHLWAALGANMGGKTAMVKFMEKTRWLYDLKRRTNGSFVYEGKEQYGGGATIDNDYFGASSSEPFEKYSDLNPTAFYLLAYSVPLKRIYLTGRNSINILSDKEVGESIEAADMDKTCKSYTVQQLTEAAKNYDPIARHDVAAELASRLLSETEMNNLIQAITGVAPNNDARLRMVVCQVLAIRQIKLTSYNLPQHEKLPASQALNTLQTTQAMTALRQRLTDSNLWVRAKAAIALKQYGTQADAERVGMLNAFIANSQDSDVVDWTDPIHISNGFLADTIFNVEQSRLNSLRNLNENLVFTALEKGLLEPSNSARSILGPLVNGLTLENVKKLAPALVKAVRQAAPADRMNPGHIRDYILGVLVEYKIEEAIPLCLMLKEQHWHGDNMKPFTLLQSYGSAAREALPTLRKWEAHLPNFYKDPSIRGIVGQANNFVERYSAIEKGIKESIDKIEKSSSSPAIVNFKTLNISATPMVNGLTKVSTTLRADMTDIDKGLSVVTWSKLSGPGPVVFNPSKRTPNANTSASFNVPGTYVLRATMVDSSILNEKIWVTHSLGYYDFKTYEQNLGAITKDITVTVETPELPRIPVSSGLVLRMDASQISDSADGAQLNVWTDTSGGGNHALRQSTSSTGYPKYVANGVNGMPVVRFDSGSIHAGDFLKFTRIPNIRTVFWVLKENPGLTDYHFLLGDSDTNDFHRGQTPNGPLWDQLYTSADIRNGETKLMGEAVNGTTTSLPSGKFQLVSLITDGNVSANQICQDRNFHGSWQGDIAEILIYDRPLSGAEEAQVGTYLSEKYGLTTAYKALPVSSGLVLRMDASQITGAADGAQLNTWADTSGSANHGIRQNGSTIGFPKFVTNGINGKPVVRFSSSNRQAGDYFKFNRISDIRTVFWVIKENARLTGSNFLLGDNEYHDFHRGSNNGPLWSSTYTSDKIKTGITKLMGNTINGTSTSLPSESFQLVSLVTTGNVQASQICQDRMSHGSWQGDIAEILIYNRVLTGTEQARVGTYLTNKYRLNTSYTTSATSTVPAALSAVADSTGKIRVAWSQVSGAVSYKVWVRNTQSNSEQLIMSMSSPCEITGLTTGIRYEFKVSSVFPSNISSIYSSLVSATPNASSGYTTWAGNSMHGLTTGLNSGPMDDPDRDGVCNLMEFTLGGAPMTASQGILPVLIKEGSSWYLEYSRSDLSQAATTQIVEYSNDLKQWDQIIIPASTSGGVSITAGRVKVNIPTVSGKPKFVRLKVTQ